MALKHIEKIKNPYIPDTFNGSTECCSKASETFSENWFTKYTDIKLNDPLRDDITGAYTPQGGCVYDGHIYRAMVKEDNEPAIIEKIRISDGKTIVRRDDIVLGHANDMFVKGGILCVLHSSSTNIVYRLTIDTLDYIDTLSEGPTRWGQAFNSVDNLDVIGTVGSAYFSVYNGGSFMYRIKPDNAFSGLVRQGIFCNDNYIGVVLDNAYGAVLDNRKGSRVMFYTWNAMFIKSVFIPIAEIEWADYVDGILYFGTYDGRDPNDVKSGKIYAIPFDLYPEQTVQTGRPTDVSGGLNNLQRLPEGTHVRLFNGEISSGTLTLQTVNTRLKMDEDGPFRYLIFRFKGANDQTMIWYPVNNGVVTLREFDITAATTDSNIRFREMRLQFNASAQTFTIESNLIEGLLSDVSEGTLAITKSPEGISGITLEQIWGII